MISGTASAPPAPRSQAAGPGHLTQGALGYGLLFLPYVAAEFSSGHAVTSYWMAWTGSFLVLYLVWTGAVRELPQDRPVRDQILRPIFLTHAVFAAYIALSSLPYFMAIHGYHYLAADPAFPVDRELVARAAAAQRYYVLAHASFASGILLAMNYRQTGTWRIRSKLSLPELLLGVSAITFLAAMAAAQFGDAGQLAIRLRAIALFGSVLSLAVALPTRRTALRWVALSLYLVNFLTAVVSGWKKEVIVVVTLLLVFAYPYYRRTVLILGPVALIALLALLPAFNATFRELSWSGTQTRGDAARASAAVVRSGQLSLEQHTWSFLTGRASEIGMFVRYLEFTPAHNDFAGLATVRRAIVAIIPRALWREKPDLESAAMERAYANNVVDRISGASAKPQFVVDGYLSAGALGVFVACLLFGMLASLASRLAEKWFGGYLLGSGLVFTSLFLTFWSGNAFEFVVPTVFWSFAVMWLLAICGRSLGVLVPSARPARRMPYARPRARGRAATAPMTPTQTA